MFFDKDINAILRHITCFAALFALSWLYDCVFLGIAPACAKCTKWFNSRESETALIWDYAINIPNLFNTICQLIFGNVLIGLAYLATQVCMWSILTHKGTIAPIIQLSISPTIDLLIGDIPMLIAICFTSLQITQIAKHNFVKAHLAEYKPTSKYYAELQLHEQHAAEANSNIQKSIQHCDTMPRDTPISLFNDAIYYEQKQQALYDAHTTIIQIITKQIEFDLQILSETYQFNKPITNTF